MTHTSVDQDWVSVSIPVQQKMLLRRVVQASPRHRFLSDLLRRGVDLALLEAFREGQVSVDPELELELLRYLHSAPDTEPGDSPHNQRSS